MCTNLYLSMSLFIYVQIHLYVCLYLCISTYTKTDMYTYHMCVYVYIICIRTCMYRGSRQSILPDVVVMWSSLHKLILCLDPKFYSERLFFFWSRGISLPIKVPFPSPSCSTQTLQNTMVLHSFKSCYLPLYNFVGSLVGLPRWSPV